MSLVDAVELYLAQYIEDRTVNGKGIAVGARNQKD